MAEKKKKGDLGDIVFPEFPASKQNAKSLPPLDVPRFSKDEFKKKEPLKTLPELKLPSFSTGKKQEEKKQPEEKKMPVFENKKPEVSRYAPPHEHHAQKTAMPKPEEIKKPVFVKKEVSKEIAAIKQAVKMPEVRQQIKAMPVKPKVTAAPVIKHVEARPMPVKPRVAVHVARPRPEPKPKYAFKPFKPLIIKHEEKIKPITFAKIKPTKIEHAKHVDHKQAKKAIHHLVSHPAHHAKHKPHHKIHVKAHHPAKIHKIRHEKMHARKIHPVVRALRHIIVKGPAKPRDKLTLKRLGHHMSDVAKNLEHLRSESVKYQNFNSLRKAVEKEVGSIKKIYHEFDNIQRDFKKEHLEFIKSKKEFYNNVNDARSRLQHDFESAKKAIEGDLAAARRSFSKHTESTAKSFHSNIESAKSFTSKELDDEKRMIRKEIDEFKKMMGHKQDEMLAKVNGRILKLTSDNEELMKDLGRLSVVDGKLNEKLDISVYNQLVRKINELEQNTAANESQLDNELKATVDYVKRLGEAFDNSVKVREAIKDRLIYHEKVIQQLYEMMQKKPKLDLNQYIEDYAASDNHNNQEEYAQEDYSTEPSAEELDNNEQSNYG